MRTELSLSPRRHSVMLKITLSVLFSGKAADYVTSSVTEALYSNFISNQEHRGKGAVIFAEASLLHQ